MFSCIEISVPLPDFPGTFGPEKKKKIWPARWSWPFFPRHCIWSFATWWVWSLLLRHGPGEPSERLESMTTINCPNRLDSDYQESKKWCVLLSWVFTRISCFNFFVMFVFVRILYEKNSTLEHQKSSGFDLQKRDVFWSSPCRHKSWCSALARNCHILSSSHEFQQLRAVPEIILKEKEWNTIIYTFWPERTDC